MFIKDMVIPHLCKAYLFKFKNVEVWPDGSETFVTDLLEHTNHLGMHIDNIDICSGFKHRFNDWNSNL